MRTLPRLSTIRVDRRRIFQARDEARLTQEQLARLMGCSFPSVQKWEGGQRTPSPKMLAKLAQVTGKPESFFLDGHEVAA